MDEENDKPLSSKESGPANQRPAFQDRLRSLMTAKPAKGPEVATAAEVPVATVWCWLSGEIIPTVAQAQRLDAFLNTNLAEEYQDLLRKRRGDKGRKINRAAKSQAAAPKPEEQPAAPIKIEEPGPADQRPAFSDRLKALMKAKPAKAKDVAGLFGYSIFTIRNWRCGKNLPNIDQARKLDAFFGSNLVEEYQDLLRRAQGRPKSASRLVAEAYEEACRKNPGIRERVRIISTVKSQAADQKPEGKPGGLKDLFKGALKLKKSIVDAAGQARQEVYGGSDTAAVDADDRQMALSILMKTVDCLTLIMKDAEADARG